MVVNSIVLVIDGDGDGGHSGGGGDSLQICPALFSHLSLPVNVAQKIPNRYPNFNKLNKPIHIQDNININFQIGFYLNSWN